MPVLGTPRSFHKKHAFLVEIPEFGRAGFSKCSEISVEAAVIKHYEGGALIPNKSPGRLEFADVTLERGATRDLELFTWFQDVVRVRSGIGLVDPLYKRTIDVVQQDRDGSTLRRWTLFNAWPTKFIAGEWDNNADEVVIETLVLTYDFFDLGRT